MIARLQTFYGRAPGKHADWLRVPAPKFWAYAKMLPRLEAEQQLQAANLHFATEGQAMEDTDRMKFLGDLQLAAQDTAARNRVATVDELQAAGIMVVVEEAPESAEKADA